MSQFEEIPSPGRGFQGSRALGGLAACKTLASQTTWVREIFKIARPRFANPCHQTPSMPSRQDELLRELPKVRRHWIIVVTDLLTLVVVLLPFWILGQ